jgi:hypothetical protein
MKEKFIKFLKKHGALRKFKKTLKEHRGDSNSNTIDTYITEEQFGDIDGAFTWDKSDEGHDYWSKLSKLWEAEKTK